MTDVSRRLEATQTEIKRALRNTINSTVINARKLAINEISTKTSLDKEFVEKKTRVKRTTQDSLEAEVLATKARLPLTAYKPTITYQGTRGSVYVDYSMTRDKELVGYRTYANPVNQKIRRRKGLKAYPIYSPTGPSVAHHWGRISGEIANKANEEMLNVFIDKLRAQIKKR